MTAHLTGRARRGALTLGVALSATVLLATTAEALAPLPLSEVRVANSQAAVRSGSATVPVSCDNLQKKDCTGVLRLRAKLGGRTQVIGRREYHVPHGQTIGVSVKLVPAAVKKIARGGGKLTATASTATAQSATATVTRTRDVKLVSPSAQAQRPSLSFVFVSGLAVVDCVTPPEGPRTATYSASGQSTDANHYPGTWTEQGSWVQTDADTGAGVLKTTFTIVSGATTITGTRTITTKRSCIQPRDSRNYLSGGWGSYTATITTAAGSFEDKGYSELFTEQDSRMMRGTFMPGAQ